MPQRKSHSDPKSNSAIDTNAQGENHRNVLQADKVAQNGIANAEEALRKSEEKYRTLFNSIDEGFSLLELIFDDNGKVIDYWHRDNNPSFVRMTGIKNPINKRMSELVPNLEPEWHQMLDQVYRTGEAIRTEYTVQQLRQWYTCYLSRVGNSGSPFVAAIYDDITDRKRNETRQEFLLNISDNLSVANSLKDVQTTVTNSLQEHYDAGWCYYVEWNEEKKTGVVLYDSKRDDLLSLAGTHDVSDIPEFLDLLKSGQILNVSDYEHYELLSPGIRERYTAAGFRSMLVTSLVRQGRLISSLIIGDTKIRNWSYDDETLLADVADRTWAAVERAKAEQALKQSEEKYRTLFEAMDEGFSIVELIFDDEGHVADFMYLEINPAFVKHVGIDLHGKRRSELNLDQKDFLLEKYEHLIRTGEPIHFEYRVKNLRDQWFEVNAVRIGDENSRHLGVIFKNITEKKQREIHQAFLLDFSDELRSLPDGDAVACRALELLIDQLQLDRSYITSYYLDEDRADVDYQVGNETVPPLPAYFVLSDYPDAFKAVFDETFVIEDELERQGLSEAERQNSGKLGMRAMVAATLRKADNRPLWSMVAISSKPRRWTPAEIKLVEEVAERTWAAIERAKAEKALCESKILLARELEDTKQLQRISNHIIDEENVEDLYHTVLLSAMELMRADFASIQLFIPEKEELLLLASENFHPDSAKFWKYVKTGSTSSCGQAMATGSRVIIEDIEYPPFEIDKGDYDAFRASGIVAVQSTPLVSHSGNNVGMMSTHWRRPHKPSERELGLYDIVARQVADLMERKKSEEALRENERRLNIILEGIGEAFYALDPEWRFLFASRSALKMWDKKAEEIFGRSFLECFPQSAGSMPYEAHQRVMTTGVTERFETVSPVLNRRIEVLIAPTRQGGLSVSFRDIEDSKRAEEALRESEQKLREFNESLEQQIKQRTAELQENHTLLQTIYNTTHVGMSVFKPVYNEKNKITDFEIVIVNKRIEDASGRKDLPGKLYSTIFPGIKKMGLLKAMVKAMETGKPVQMEYFYEYEGVNRWYSTMFIRNNGMLVSSNMDLTEQKLAEEKNREFDRRQKELEEKQQQEIFRAVLDTQEIERKRIAENLHNSLGQMLYAIKLSLAAVNKSNLGEPEKESLKNADKLLTDAISESRRLSHELMPVILEDFGLKAAVEDICRKLSDKVRIKCRVKGLTKKMDRHIETAIYRLVQELVMNAVKHSGATEALVAIETNPSGIAVSVQDNGRGFNAGKEKAGGIGLKTIRNNVNLLNGHINIASKPGAGTTINIEVPYKPNK